MAQAKKIFVVKGSEDGNLGVYGSAGAAVDKALAYVSQNESSQYKIEKTRAQYITLLGKQGWLDVKAVSDDDYEAYGTAEVELFYLNQ